jgi:hypothetical protein
VNRVPIIMPATMTRPMEKRLAAPAPAAVALKKGSLVKVSSAAYGGSLEAGASDPTPPAYLLEGPGEILAIKGEYAQLRWRRPVPDVWLRLDQLEAF